jgi:hypothetical protein
LHTVIETPTFLSDCRRAGLSEDDRHTAKGVFRMEHQLSAASWAVGSPEFGTPLLTINNSSNFFDDISKIIERISEIALLYIRTLEEAETLKGLVDRILDLLFRVSSLQPAALPSR